MRRRCPGWKYFITEQVFIKLIASPVLSIFKLQNQLAFWQRRKAELRLALQTLGFYDGHSRKSRHVVVEGGRGGDAAPIHKAGRPSEAQGSLKFGSPHRAGIGSLGWSLLEQAS